MNGYPVRVLLMSYLNRMRILNTQQEDMDMLIIHEHDLELVWNSLKSAVDDFKEFVQQFVESELIPTCFHFGLPCTADAVAMYVCVCVLAKRDPRECSRPDQKCFLVHCIVLAAQCSRIRGMHRYCMRDLYREHNVDLDSQDGSASAKVFEDLSLLCQQLRYRFYLQNES